MSDPTCVNGGVYYNSASDQAKICINSSWAAVGVPRVTSLPGSPANGDEVYYVADASEGVLWHLRYNSSSTYWEKIGGPPLIAEVETQQSTSSTSYTNLATVGPSITTPLAGDYDISIGSYIIAGSSTLGAYRMSYQIGGTAASDNDAVVGVKGNNEGLASVSREMRKTGLATSTALVAKYKASAGTADFRARWMVVDPVRVQ